MKGMNGDHPEMEAISSPCWQAHTALILIKLFLSKLQGKGED